MDNKERIFKILLSPHISEKSTIFLEKTNTVVFRVVNNATKSEIKNAVQKLFKVQVNNINTLMIKGKRKRKGNYFNFRNNWKKAYVTLKKNYNIDLISSAE